MERESITVAGVRKRYGVKLAVEALAGVDLTVAESEFVCLVGPSGCGKSTLLRMIAGIHQPSEGQIALRLPIGNSVATAMVFQDYGIFPWKTVEANVRFGLEVTGTSAKESRDRVGHWLDRMGLTEFRSAYPATLSGGMKQRVSIARALAVEPGVLLMDEPFAALDAQMRRILQDELLALWQEDLRTVVFVTHSLEEAILLGDRVVVMSSRPGRIIADFRVPFARPRSPEVRLDPAFTELEETIWEQLRKEVGDSERKAR
ncbi:mannosyltransferase (plasmid) [Rhodococcus opacus]|uniref:Mannosyltransferase n=1 Tax=Rhodococcus opacus TaxID=37919 RepID=A0A076EYN6_RHOOP|nr:mannosyltransferase [Rhodococcus opacus]